MATLLDIRGVDKWFGGLRALDNVSFSVEEGWICSLIGPNGAGKTTLFNIIAGTLRPDAGEVVFAGEKITGMRPYQICRRGIARTFQLKTLFSGLTVFENVLAGMLKEPGPVKKKYGKVFEILEFLGLDDKANVRVADLPPLEARLVELGRALATRPKLLLLDELIGGLLPSETEQICKRLTELKSLGMTILQVSHEMGPIMRTSDWIVVLNRGQVLATGTVKDILANKAVHEVYLEIEEEIEERT